MGNLLYCFISAVIIKYLFYFILFQHSIKTTADREKIYGGTSTLGLSSQFVKSRSSQWGPWWTPLAWSYEPHFNTTGWKASTLQQGFIYPFTTLRLLFLSQIFYHLNVSNLFLTMLTWWVQCYYRSSNAKIRPTWKMKPI